MAPQLRAVSQLIVIVPLGATECVVTGRGEGWGWGALEICQRSEVGLKGVQLQNPSPGTWDK